MKPFNEFWSSISEDEFFKIAQKVNSSSEKIRKETENPENLFGNQIAVTSVVIGHTITN